MRSGRLRSGGWAAIGLALVIGVTGPSAAEDSREGVSHAAEDGRSGAPSDIDLWRMIIRDSIESYRHLCPCPYSPNRAGKPCGSRSAYSRVDGSVMCYVTDIPEAEVVRYRRRLETGAGGEGQQNQQ